MKADVSIWHGGRRNGVELHKAVLCYIDGERAYFTTQALETQRGNGWRKAPYENNADEPHTFTDYDAECGSAPWQIIKVEWQGPFVMPGNGRPNSPFSVREINERLVPWLTPADWSKHTVIIMAGTTLTDFIQLVHQVGGTVTVPAS